MSDAIARLTAAYELEQKNQSPPRTANDIPLSYEAITDEWLTSVVCRGHPGAAVTSHRLGDRDEGNTSRRRLYLAYNDAGRAARLPASVFCKASHQLASRISTGICGGIYCEVSFYNKIRPLLDIEAPVPIWANYDHETMNSIVMLRDLGGAAQFCGLDTDMTEERLRGQMELLATLHGRFYHPKELARLPLDLPTWPEYFGRLADIGIESICANGFQAAREAIPPRLFARASEIWPATLASVAIHSKLPRTLIHSDVHLRNWYIAGNGKMGLNDWQGACKGHWGRDVAYALTAAMTVERRRRLTKELINHYLMKLREVCGAVISLEEAVGYYRQQLFGALAWWTITMPSPTLPAMQPIDVTLEMIRRITHAIDDFDALDSFH